MSKLTKNMNVDTGEKTWLTPKSIIDALGPFDLDPCCPPQMPWSTAAEMICRPANGLEVDWLGKRVWCNPPYGREAVPFLRKMALQRQSGGGNCSHIRPYGHIGMAEVDFSIRIRNLVRTRSYQILSHRRNSRRDGPRAVCACRVFRERPLFASLQRHSRRAGEREEIA